MNKITLGGMVRMARIAGNRTGPQAPVAAALAALLLLLAPVQKAMAAPITSDQAKSVVTSWLAVDANPLEIGAKTVGEVSVYPGVDGTNAFYVVSLLPAGYVVVAADSLVGPVIALSGKGAFDPSPNNSLYTILRNDLPRRLAAARAQAALTPVKTSGTVTAQTHPTPETALCRVRVPPLLSSRWGRGIAGDAAPIFNYYTPSNAAAGNAAVCLAEIIRLHRQEPPDGVGLNFYLARVNEEPTWLKTRGGNGAGGPYNWDAMLDDPANTPGITLEQIQAVGSLIADVGAAVTHADYDTRHGTADSIGAAPTALKNVYGFANGGVFGRYNLALDPLYAGDEPFVSPPTDPEFGMINANLDAGLPVLLTLMPSDPNLVYQVAVDCDGYGYSRTSSGESWMFHHINFASGKSAEDIWYTLPVVQGGLNFSNIFEVIYNIMPTNAGEIVSGRVVDQDGISMPGITMQITSGSYSNRTVTGARGIYAFIVPANDNYTVSVVSPIGTPETSYHSQPFWVGQSVDDTSVGNVWGVNFSIPSYLIAGRIVKDGAPLVRAQVTFTNIGTVQTDLDGYFMLPVPAHWSGTLTPWMPLGGTFDPPSTNLTDVTAINTNVNFIWTAPTLFAISGTVFRADTLTDVTNAVITFSNAGVNVAIAATDANGDYVGYVPTNWTGTATPSHPDGGVFYPATRSYPNMASNVEFQYYYWMPPLTNTISGRVIRRDTGAPVAGVVLRTSDGQVITTDADGVYTLPVSYLWSGSVTPSHPRGGTFLAASRSYASVHANIVGQNYLWVPPPPTVSGFVYRADEPYGPVWGVTIQFSGSIGKVITSANGSAADGSYAMSLPYGWIGTATPSHPVGGTFFPASMPALSTLTNDVFVQNYNWSPPLQAISGRVTRVDNGAPVAGVTVKFINKRYFADDGWSDSNNAFMPMINGGADRDVITDADGFYSLVVPFGWSGAVVPSFAVGGGFTPYVYASFNHGLGYYGYLFNYFGGTSHPATYDFTWTPPPPVINGYVLRGDAPYGPVSNATVTFSGGAGSAVSGADGSYRMTLPVGWAGTATPSYPAFGTFSPTNMSFVDMSLNSTYRQDYRWYPLPLAISGRVTRVDNGAPVGGVAVAFTNTATPGPYTPLLPSGASNTVVTGTNGWYSFTVPFGWSGSSTPSHPFGGTFSPTLHTYITLTSGRSAEHFTWSPPPPSIMGRVVRSDNGRGVSGISVVFSNNADLVAGGATNPLAVATTDTNGNYRVVVGFGWGGTVTPATPNFPGTIFTPVQRAFTNVQVDITDTNLTRFVMTPQIVFVGPDPMTGLDFGSVPVGQTASRTVVIRNNSRSVCNVLGTAPPANGAFTALPGSYTLNPGATNVITVTFRPTAPIVFTGSVTFATLPEPAGGAPSFAVRGVGTQLSEMLYYTGSLDFGVVYLKQSVSRTITLYNVSASSLKVSGKWSNGTDFSVSGLPATIPAGGSKSITITLKPKTLKDYNGAMLVLSATGVSSVGNLVPVSQVMANLAGTWTAKINKQHYTLYLRQNLTVIDGVMVCEENGAINDQYVAGLDVGTLTGALWNAGSPIGSTALTASKDTAMAGTLTRTGLGTGLAVKWSKKETTVPGTVVFPPRPALASKQSAVAASTVAAALPAAALHVTLVDLLPAALLPEDAELLVVTLQDGRPTALSPALERADLSWLLESRIESEGADANSNGIPDLVEAALGVPLEDGMELLVVRKHDGQAVPEAPYAGTTVEGAAAPLHALPATWSLQPKAP
jgi:hypothetical protein